MRLNKEDFLVKLREIIDKITSPPATHSIHICCPPHEVKICDDTAYKYCRDLRNILRHFPEFWLEGESSPSINKMETTLGYKKNYAQKLWAIGAFLKFWTDPIYGFQSDPYSS